jgi:tetratricopeptide (TPR) repeat protein
MDIPPWLAAPDRQVTAHPWVDEAWRRVVTSRVPLTVTGPAGTGRTMAMAAVVARHARPTVGARLTGCVSAADVVRAIGFVLDVPLPGETSRVGAALAGQGKVLVVLDDAVAAEVANAVQTLSALAPRALFLASSIHPITPGASLIPPKDWRSPVIEPARIQSLPNSVEWLAHLPAGVLVDQIDGLPADLIARLVPARVALQPGIAAMILNQRPVSPELAARRCEHLGSRFLPLATGGEVYGPVQMHDILLLRFLAQHLVDPTQAALHTAAAARVLAGTGQPEEGLSVLSAFRDRVRRLPLREEALLLWAEGDVLLDTGLESQARLCHALALERLQDVRDPDLGGTLLRRLAGRLLLRGHTIAAEKHYQRARVLHRKAADTVAIAATLRGVADVAIAAGENVSAGALYEQAAATLETRPRARLELASLRLGQAALAIGRGELGEAERMLDEARQLGQGSALLQAVISRRRAELLLRKGRQGDARKLLVQAEDTLFRLGERAAAAATIRIQADLEAAAGNLLAAADGYQRALAECARVGDLATAQRILEHLLSLERYGSSMSRVQSLQGLLSDVRALLAPRDEATQSAPF